jgi:peroxiredoxin
LRIDVNEADMRKRLNQPLPVFALICLSFFSPSAQQSDSLAEFSLPKLDGQTLRSQDLKDKIVVLDFWATWCENCVSEIPEFNKLEKEYSSRGVKVVGLAVQSGWATDIQKFARQYKMNYTVLVGNDDTVSDFGVISFPNTYVIGPGWKLYKKYSGVSENKAADIRQDIETLLKVKR